MQAFLDDKLKVAQEMNVVYDKLEKHCRIKRKCWLPAFSPFPTIFSEAVSVGFD